MTLKNQPEQPELGRARAWYVHAKPNEPVAERTLRQQLAAGTLPGDTLVRRSGDTRWQPLKAALASAPAAQWRVLVDGKRRGPFSLRELRAGVSGGKLTPETLAWRPGLAEWTPLRACPELAATLPPAAIVVDEQAARRAELERLVRRAPDADARQAALLELAELAHTTGDRPTAVARFRQALAARPDDARAFEGLETLYRDGRAWSSLFDLYQHRAQVLDGPEAAPIYERLGALAHQALKRPARAIEAYDRALALGGARPTSLRALVTLHAGSQPETALSHLDRLLRLEVPDRDALLERGVRIARKLGPDHVVPRLRALLVARPSDLTAHGELVDALIAVGPVEARLDAEAALLAQLPATHPARLPRLRAHAQAQTAAGRDASATWRAVLDAAPTDDEARAAVEATLADEPGALVDLRLSETQRLDGPERLGALRELAAWCEANAPASAARVWRAVVALRPGDADAQARLARHLDAAQDWQTKVAVLVERLERTRGDSRRQALYREIAGIFEQHLDEPEGAYTALSEAFAETFDDATLGADLGRMARRAGKMADLVATYERTLALFEEGAPVAPLEARVGRWCADDLGDADRALPHFDAALALAPKHAGTIDGLFALATQGHAGAAERLLPSLTAQGDWRRVHTVQRLLVDARAPGADRAEALVNLADLCFEKLGRPDEALAWLGEALRETPEASNLFARMQALGRHLDDPGLMVDALSGGLDAAQRPADVARLGKAVATLRAELGDAAGAANAWRRVLDVRPDDAEALVALAAHHEAEGAHGDLVEVLGRQLAEARGATRQALAQRLAEAADRLADPAGQLDAWRAALVAEPTLHATRRKLVAHLRAEGRWAEVHAALEPATGLGDHAARAAVHAELAELCTEQLERPAEAIGHWRAALELGGEQRTPLEALRALQTDDPDAERAVLTRLRPLVEPAERVAVDADLARLHTRAGDLGAAAGAWQACLAGDADHAEAPWALHRLWADGGPAAEPAAVLGVLLARESLEAATRIDLLRARAALRAEQLDDAAGAVADLEAVLVLRPEDAHALEAIEGLHDAAGDAAATADALHRRAAITKDADAAIALRLRVAELHPGDLGDAALRRVLADRPEHAAAFDALAARLEARRDWPALADVLVAHLPHVAGAAHLALVDRAAGIARVKLADPGRALDLLLPTLAERPSDDAVLDRIAEAAAAAHRWPSLIEAADAIDDRALAVRAAQWTATGLGDAADAVRRLDTLAKAKADAPVLTALMQLTEGGDAIRAAADALEPLLGGPGDRVKLYTVLGRRVAHEPVEAQLGTLARLAELAEGLRRPDEQWQWRLRAFERQPADADADAALVKLAGEQGRFAELATAYDATAAQATDAEAIRRLGHRAADLYKGRLKNEAEAERAWRDVLDRADAGDRASVEGLTRLLSAAGRHAELADVLDAAAAATAHETRALDWRFRAGEALAADGRPAEAISRFEAVVEAVPDHRRALAQLETLRGEVGDRAGLLAVLEARAAHAPHDADLRVRAAHLASELGRVEAAIDWWQQALDLGADEPEALGALEPLSRRAARWPVYADVCERLRTLARDDRTVVRLDRQLGHVYAAHLDRPREALAAWESVLRRRPDDVEALWAAHGLYAQLDDAGGRAQAEQRLLTLLPEDDARRGDLLRGLATTYEDRLALPEDALTTWRALLAADPDHAEADAKVEALCRQIGDHAGLAERFEARADRAEGDARAHWLLALADVSEAELGDVDRAREACREAANLRPHDEALLDRLERLHTECEAWGDLAWLHDWRIAEGPVEAQVAALVRAADVRERHLGRPAEAAGLLARAVALAPEPAHLDAAARLAELTGEWTGLAEAAEQALHAERGEPSVLHRRLAAWYAEALAQPADALRHLHAALALDPADAEAHAGVEPLLRRLEDWPALVAWLRPSDDAAPSARRAALAAIAEVQAQRLHDKDAALATWRAVLDADPTDAQALAHVERLSAELDDWAGLAELCRAHAERLQDPEARAERFVRLGDLYAGPLEVPAAALAAYREALDAVPNHAGAVAAFEAVCLQTGNLDLLNTWYASRMDGARVAPKPARAPVAEPAAKPAIEPKASPVEAVARETEPPAAPALSVTAPPAPVPAVPTPQPLLTTPPSLPPAPPSVGGVLGDADRATRALEAAYRAEGRWAELAALYRRRHSVAPDGPERVQLETALLDLYLGPADDPARAAALLKPRLAEEKNPRFLMQQLSDLYCRAEDWPAAARMLRNEAELATLKVADRLPLFDRLARVYRDHLDDATLAAGWWRTALEFDPEYQPALEGLHGLLLAEQAAAPAPEAQAPVAQADSPTVKRPRGPRGPVKRYTVNRTAAQSKRRRRLLWALAAVGLVWGLVATSGFVIQSLRLDQTTDEMETANRAYSRLAKEVTTTQEQFTQVARTLNEQHGDGTPLELYASDPVNIPEGESAMLTDKILGIAINDIKMRSAVGAMRGLVGGVVEQRQIAVAQAETLQGEMDGLRDRLAKLDQAKGVADELLAQKLDTNLEQLETALDVTGLNLDAMLNPDLDAVAKAAPGEPTAVGGPFKSTTTTYASPIPGGTAVMSGFGWRGKEHHNGIDIPCDFGTPARAVAEGEVIFVQDRATWEARPKMITRKGKRIKSPGWRAGVYVEIRHVDNRVSRYLHLDNVSPGIKQGAKVRKRQVIGTVGRTAVEHSRTHLHFELREPPAHPGHRWGKPVDPEAPLTTPDPAQVAKGVEALSDEARRLASALNGEDVGLGGDDDANTDASKNATAQILGSLGVQGRVDRLHRIEKLMRALPLVAPVDDFKVTSGFGKRKDPMAPGKTAFHAGIDIPGEHKSVVMATAPGKVIYSGWKGGFGRMIEIDHGQGIVTRYGHLYKGLVRVGQHVKMREKIGLMGSSGRSTGTHLHYEVVVNGKPQDPIRYLKAGRQVFNQD